MGGIDTRLVVDVLEALLKENDMDEQEGYCRVKGQVKNMRSVCVYVSCCSHLLAALKMAMTGKLVLCCVALCFVHLVI